MSPGFDKLAYLKIMLSMNYPHNPIRAILVLVLLFFLLLINGCVPILDVPRTPDDNLSSKETAVIISLSGTLTAGAPTRTPFPTNTPQPPMPTPTPTRAPFLSGSGPFLAFVRLMEEGTENIILRSGGQSESVLTRFSGGQSISDLNWSLDGQWLVFTSAFNYMLSRKNERNVFVVRPDGTELHMISGEFVDPETVEGPFITLSGTVTGTDSSCLVSAQGAAGPVTTTVDGAFELPGVPVSSKWARAVCNQGDVIRQGDVPLELTEGVTSTINITVTASGQGWLSAAISPDGCKLAGIKYEWSLDDQGKRVNTMAARLVNLGGGQIAELMPSEGAVVSGLAWSPEGTQLVGTVNWNNSVSLWLWDAEGNSLGSLIDIPNPEDTFYTLGEPVWSYDGSKIAYTRQSYYWWSGTPQLKTEIDVIDVNTKEVTTIVPEEYGFHATSPAWSANGLIIYYQLASGDPSAEVASLSGWQIWWIDINGRIPTQLTKDGVNTLPAVRSNNLPRTTSLPGCLEP